MGFICLKNHLEKIEKRKKKGRRRDQSGINLFHTSVKWQQTWNCFGCYLYVISADLLTTKLHFEGNSNSCVGTFVCWKLCNLFHLIFYKDSCCDQVHSRLSPRSLKQSPGTLRSSQCPVKVSKLKQYSTNVLAWLFSYGTKGRFLELSDFKKYAFWTV